jgi:hypothetical protein
VLGRIPAERRAMLHAWLAAHLRPAG